MNKRDLSIIRRWEESRCCQECGQSLMFEPMNKLYCDGACRQAAYRKRRYDFLRDLRRNRNARRRNFDGADVFQKGGGA
jgi:hypothetical protein